MEKKQGKRAAVRAAKEELRQKIRGLQVRIAEATNRVPARVLGGDAIAAQEWKAKAHKAATDRWIAAQPSGRWTIEKLGALAAKLEAQLVAIC